MWLNKTVRNKNWKAMSLPVFKMIAWGNSLTACLAMMPCSKLLETRGILGFEISCYWKCHKLRYWSTILTSDPGALEHPEAWRMAKQLWSFRKPLERRAAVAPRGTMNHCILLVAGSSEKQKLVFPMSSLTSCRWMCWPKFLEGCCFWKGLVSRKLSDTVVLSTYINKHFDA